MARPRWKLALTVLLGGALTIGLAGLGIWQIQRLVWKRDLIARVESRIHAAPVSFDTLDLSRPKDAEYRHVTLTGEFDNRAESFVQAVTELGGGYWLLTPLRSSDGSVVLINRGFVPPERRDPVTRGLPSPTGPVTVNGLVRLSEPDGAFLRSNQPGEDRWYSRDVAAIAAARGLTGVAPVFVDAEAQPGAPDGVYPVGGLTVVNFRNTHLIYAVTWFVLAAMVAGFVILLLRHDRHSR